MLSKTIKIELKMLFPRVIVLDAFVYLISMIFLGINYSMIFGLILGTITMFLNFILVGISVENAIIKYKLTNNEKKAKKVMQLNYLLRYILVGFAIYLSFSDKFGFLFNTFGVVIPLIYPKLIYIFNSIFAKKRKED